MLYPFLNMGAIAALRRRRNYLLYKEKLKKSINDDWDHLDHEIWVCKLLRLFPCIVPDWAACGRSWPGVNRLMGKK